jgi:succinate dehydrogenase/fumarate reductase flavoprotein subunit
VTRQRDDARPAATDVVVVGCGAAGASAAIEARASGASVTIFERMPTCGGTTAIAGGHIYLGGGTPVQVACGFDDTPDNMYAYLTAVSRDPGKAKIRAYCDGSVEHFHWLEAHGVAFDRSYLPGKHLFQYGRDCLVWTGNETVWPFRDLARPQPRGHKPSAEGDAGGVIADALASSAQAAGANLETEVKVTGLRKDEFGRVLGVLIERAGTPSTVDARGGVVLAGGGFVMSREMVARHVPVLASVEQIGSSSDDGAAIRMGVDAGGAVEHMDGAFLSATHYPPTSGLRGLIVNRDGERFVAEDSYHGRTGSFVAAQPDGIAYLILDEATFARPQLGTLPFVDGWGDVSAMERDLQMPTGALAKTIAEYNRHAANGDDPRFHKAPEYVQPLEPPYAAFDMSLGKARYCGFTLGGLATSADSEVLDEQHRPIAGLYAAGACASNLAQDGLSYNSGLSIGEATYFGRSAGRHAARRAARTSGEVGDGEIRAAELQRP